MPPAIATGVLCLDGVEISTTGGHYVALDMPAVAVSARRRGARRRRGCARGSAGSASRPIRIRPRPSSAGASGTRRFDGIELLNPDTSWRLGAAGRRDFRAPRGTSDAFARRLFDYPFRPAESIAALLQPSRRLARVGRRGRAAARRRHRRRRTRTRKIALWRRAIPETTASGACRFRATSRRSARCRSTSGRIARCPEQRHGGRRDDRAGDSGRASVYVRSTALATPASFEFTAANASRDGERRRRTPAAGGPVMLRVRSNAPRRSRRRSGTAWRLLSGDHHEPEFTVRRRPGPAVYRVEIRAPPDPPA